MRCRGGVAGQPWDSLRVPLCGGRLAGGEGGERPQEKVLCPPEHFQGPGCGQRHGLGWGVGRGQGQYQHILPVLLLWCLALLPAPGRCSLEAWCPENIPRETLHSLQKLSVQDGLWGRKISHHQQAANRVVGKEGNPTSGKASPGSHLPGGVAGGRRGISGVEDKWQGGRR